MAKLEYERVQLENIFSNIIAALETNKVESTITHLVSFYSFLSQHHPALIKEFSFEKIIKEIETKYKGVEKSVSDTSLKNATILINILQQDFQLHAETNKYLDYSYSYLIKMLKLFADIHNVDLNKINIDYKTDIDTMLGKIKIPLLVQQTTAELFLEYTQELNKRISPWIWFWQKTNNETNQKNNSVDTPKL